MQKLKFFSILLAVTVIFSLAQNFFFAADYVLAQEDWKSEFEDVCSKTQDAMTFSADELKNLIARCDKLKPLIDKLDESPRKVYLRRLQLCKDLFVFVLGSKEGK